LSQGWLVQPRVRHSKLVRVGLVLVLSVGRAGRRRPLQRQRTGFGFVLAFTTPLGAVMMLLGAVQALLED
jgi:hypothetical protein